MLTPDKLLIEVENLLTPPEHWMQNRMAMNSNGVSVPPKSPDASCWCLVGALRKVCPDESNYVEVFEVFEEARKVLCRLIGKENFLSLADYNDHPTTTHSDILDLIRKARAALGTSDKEPK